VRRNGLDSLAIAALLPAEVGFVEAKDLFSQVHKLRTADARNNNHKSVYKWITVDT
jgi:hypothetical protein